MADLGFVAEGVRLSLARSKTDQEAAGQIVGVVATGTSTCPVAALRTWLKAAGITDGAGIPRDQPPWSARPVSRVCPTGPSC